MFFPLFFYAEGMLRACPPIKFLRPPNKVLNQKSRSKTLNLRINNTINQKR